MKRILTILFAAVLLVAAASCGKKNESFAVRTGDLMFVKIPAGYDLYTDSMPDSTGGFITIHVAILEVEHDSTWVIDATIKHGVDRHPLDTFLRDFTLKDGSYPELEIKRPAVSQEQARKFVDNAKTFIGLPYDCSFAPDNDSLYCSELVRNSYVLSDGTPLFAEYSMDFRGSRGDMPVYWTELFDILGIAVPQGKTGTTPSQMSEEPILDNVSAAEARQE